MIKATLMAHVPSKPATETPIRHEVDVTVWPVTALWVEEALAGAQYNVCIGGRLWKLTLPAENVDDALYEPPSVRWIEPPFRGRRRRPATAVSASAKAMVPQGLLVVSAVRIRGAVEVAPSQFNDAWRALTTHIDPWFSLVDAWLNAWTGVLREGVTLRSPRLQGAVWTTGKPPVGVGGGGSAPVFNLEVSMANASEVKAAFAAASAAVPLPVGWDMLHAAARARRRSDRRRCAIDACCAAELALASSLSRRIAQTGLPAEKRERFINKTSGIVDFARLHEVFVGTLGVSVDQVIDQLAGPRNAAAHDGAEPNEVQLRNCLRTARIILDTLAPIPTPTEVLRMVRSRTGN